MTTYWFKPKRYGYGATPVTWQGWALTAACIAGVMIALSLTVVHSIASPAAWLVFFAVEAVIVALMIVVCRAKTDGKWRWRWGDR